MFPIPPEILLGLVSGVGGFFMKMAAQKQADTTRLLEASIKRDQATSALQDAAAKRSSPFLRKMVALIVIIICFGMLPTSAILDIPVHIIKEIPKDSILWGFFKWGQGYEVISVTGMVYPDWVRYSVISIISFLFGTGAAKVSR